MNLKTIQDKMNAEFAQEGRRIVFWYDDNAEFKSEINELALENAKLHNMDENAQFQTKYLLEKADSDTNYLVYAPFKRPPDAENHLADTVYYSRVFHADRVSLLCADLAIPDALRGLLHKHSSFFASNERVEKFVALQIQNYTVQSVTFGMMAVLARSKTATFEDILKNVLLDFAGTLDADSPDLQNSKVLLEFEKKGLLDDFWALCERNFGYAGPSIMKLVACLLMTYTSSRCKNERLCDEFVLAERHNATVFVSNFMNTPGFGDAYDRIADEVAAYVRLNEKITIMDDSIETLAECDTFRGFDHAIISFAVRLLADGEEEPLAEHYETMLKNRAQSFHYSETFKAHYKALCYASDLTRRVGELEIARLDMRGIVREYCTSWHMIDRCYRKFYYYFDQLKTQDYDAGFDQLRRKVENLYADYLSRLSLNWPRCVEDNGMSRELVATFTSSGDFYRKYLAESPEKATTVVIISDAFRYECGAELLDDMSRNPKFAAELDFMIAPIPSYTKLGMAALLPHEKISYSVDMKTLTVDDKPSDSTEQRGKILCSYSEPSAAISFKDIALMDKAAMRERLSGSKIVYIYHDMIDATGDKQATENEVWAACAKTIHDIQSLILKITNNLSYTHFLITADHGFLYRRDKLEECDKFSLAELKGEDAVINRRFILSGHPLEFAGTQTYSLSYLRGFEGDVFVTVPCGADIFKVPGSGQNYVHGGASLQEIVVPLLRVKTARGAVRGTETVQVVLAGATRRITSLVAILEFMQKEKVSDELRPAEIKAYFVEDVSGREERISDEALIIAGERNTSPEGRVLSVKFTLKNRQYSRNGAYSLVMRDKNSDALIKKYEFTIDIAFAGDFGFNV